MPFLKFLQSLSVLKNNKTQAYKQKGNKMKLNTVCCKSSKKLKY